jgi:hypothetical protein
MPVVLLVSRDFGGRSVYFSPGRGPCAEKGPAAPVSFGQGPSFPDQVFAGGAPLHGKKDGPDQTLWTQVALGHDVLGALVNHSAGDGFVVQVRQDDHRKVRCRTMDGPEDFDAGDVRKADVQKHRVHISFPDAVGRRIEPLGPLHPQERAFAPFHNLPDVSGIFRIMLDKQQVKAPAVRTGQCPQRRNRFGLG